MENSESEEDLLFDTQVMSWLGKRKKRNIVPILDSSWLCAHPYSQSPQHPSKGTRCVVKSVHPIVHPQREKPIQSIQFNETWTQKDELDEIKTFTLPSKDTKTIFAEQDW